MTYKFQKITTIYPEYAGVFHEKNPNCARLSYQEVYQQLIDEFYGWADYFGKYLGLAGYQTQELFANLEVLQQAWAKENGVRFSRRNWLREIVLAQVRAFQPDILFLEDLYVFDRDFRQELRGQCKRPVKMIGWRAAPTEDYGVFKDLDLVLTCAPVFVEAMLHQGIQSELMWHAFEPLILNKLSTARADLDFTFVGSISLRDGFHLGRYALIERLMQTTPLEMWGDISTHIPLSAKARLVNGLTSRANAAAVGLFGARLRVPGWLRSEESPPAIKVRHPDRFHKAVFGLDSFELFNRSRMTFNCHIDCAETSAGNVRLFEATGVGTCLITDWKANLPEMFEPETEVVTYKSIEECIEKVRYLLDHEEGRQAIAAAGQRRTLRDHNFVQRAAQLDEIIRRLMKGHKTVAA